MGVFSFVGDAWNGATHLASDAWNGVTDLAGDAWHGIEDVGGFLAKNWKTLAAVAVGTLAFVAVATFAPELLPGLFVLAPELAPWLVLGGAGAASGAATRIFDDVANGRTPGWDVLKSAAITGAFTVVTAGTLSWLAPKIGDALPFLKPLTSRWVIAGGEAGDGATTANAVIKMPTPKVAPAEPSTDAVPVTALGDTQADPEEPFHLSPVQAILRAPKTRGIIGLLSGGSGGTTNKKLDTPKKKKKDPKPSVIARLPAPRQLDIFDRAF